MLVCGTLYRVCHAYSVLHVGHPQCGLYSSRTSAQASVRCQRLLLTRTSCAAISCTRQPKPRNAVYNVLQRSVQHAATPYHCTVQRAATQFHCTAQHAATPYHCTVQRAAAQHTVVQYSTAGCDVLHHSTTNAAASCARQANVQTVWRSALLLRRSFRFGAQDCAARAAQQARGGSWRGTAGAANVDGRTKAQGNKGTRLMGIRRLTNENNSFCAL